MREISQRLQPPMPLPAQRDVQIVAQPGRQGDVPASPEIGRRRREIGRQEISREFDIEELGHPAGDVGIAGKIAVDLSGEGIGKQQARSGRYVCGLDARLDQFDEMGEIVGQHYLLEQSPADQPGPRLCLCPGNARPLGRNLGQQVGCACDRPGDQLRKEGNKSDVVDQLVVRGEFAPIDVRRVADGVKGVERNARRQDHRHDRNRHGQTRP